MRPTLRHLFASVGLACLLLAPGVSQAAEGGKRFEFARIGAYFVTGAKFYGDAFSDLFSRLFGRFVPTGGGEGASCEEALKCGRDLSCLNVCLDDSCSTYAKRCMRGTGATAIVPEYSPCGPANVCAVGTTCTRTCPQGAACPVTHRCLKPTSTGAACGTDVECVEGCANLGFPPIGASGWRASCVEGSCGCALQETDPQDPIAECDGPIAMACPAGQRARCTVGTDGAVRPTCLYSPEYGGPCLADVGCSEVGCAEGSEPFCDVDRSCRCRSVSVETVSCTSVDECGAIECDPGQERACFEGTCSCAQKERLAPTTACQRAEDCSECVTGYTPACVQNACTCQRVTENVPVACTTVADCGAVSCPAEYEKTCHQQVCACARTVVQE